MFSVSGLKLECAVDGVEGKVNLAAEGAEDNDDDDGDQHEDERVFNQALAFFAGVENHDEFSKVSITDFCNDAVVACAIE